MSGGELRKLLDTGIHVSMDHDWPETPEPGCCMGAAVYGPGRCTCWQPVFTEEQEEPKTQLAAQVRAAMCEDCAYRPGSPEREGDPDYRGDEETLDTLVAAGRPFWCHQGMRKPVAHRHPSGMEVTAHAAEYRPAQVGALPFKADGTPGDLCAGWAARRLAYLSRAAHAAT